MRGVTDRPLVFLGVLTTLDCSFGQIVARLRSIHARENPCPDFCLGPNDERPFMLTAVAEIEPRDAFERMLAVHMAAKPRIMHPQRKLTLPAQQPLM